MEYEITGLNAQKKNPHRVNVYLDGEYAFSLARITAAWLQIGQRLDDKAIETLQKKDTDEKAFQSAMRLLNYRPRSEAEVKKKLTDQGFNEEVIEMVLDRLRRNGLVDDRGFARAWVENQTNFRPRGRRALTMELHQKGIPDEVIRSALSEAEDEESLAYLAGQRAARRWAHLDKLAFRQKVGQFLGRRGFSYSTIAPVVSRLWDETRIPQDTAGSEDVDDIDDEE